MIASSSTALANLAYLIGAAVLALIGGVVVWVRHRQPRSVDANMASFRRGLSALAPDPGTPPARERRAEQQRVRPVPLGLTHVRVGPPPVVTRETGPGRPARGEAARREGPGGQPG